MKKYFDLPAVKAVSLEQSRDVIMTSALAVQKAGLGTLKDEAPAPDSTIWTGSGDGWV